MNLVLHHAYGVHYGCMKLWDICRPTKKRTSFSCSKPQCPKPQANTLLVDSLCDPSIIARAETCTISALQFEHTSFSRAWKPIVPVVNGTSSSVTDGVLHLGQLSSLIIVDRACLISYIICF